ncbi:MAG: SRPBCC family protein [Deltaproteobacteria bacterium]|nr:SRPBCC family protein [Deltaproteobacteria bacterium]
MLKKVAVVVAVVFLVLVALVFGGGRFIDGSIDVGTRKRIAAPPAAIFGHLDNAAGIHSWWNAAGDAEHALDVRKKSGPDVGAGVVVTFHPAGSDDVMETWTVKASEPPARIVYDVDFAGMMTVERTLTLAAEGDGTEVTWHETGLIDTPAFRWMKLMMSNEDVVKNFDSALSLLERALRNGKSGT